MLDALGREMIAVETVGVGQSEVAIAAMADCTVLVTMPGGGDAIQTLKAGVMDPATVAAKALAQVTAAGVVT